MNLRVFGERFMWGFLRPLRLLVGLRANPPAFRRALRAAFVQLFATVLLTGAVVAYRGQQFVEKRIEQKARRAFPTPPQPPPVAAPVEVPPSPDEADAENEASEAPASPAAAIRERVAAQLDEQAEASDDPQQKSAMHEAAERLRQTDRSKPATAPPAPPGPPEAELAAALDEAAKGLAEDGKHVTDPMQKRAIRDAMKQVRDEAKKQAARQKTKEARVAEDLDDDDEEAKLPLWERFWALLVSTIFAAQWVVLALARDYQDRTSRELSLLAGIEPEEDDAQPRVRIDWQWLRRKLRRRIRGVLVLIPGFVIAGPVLLLASATGAGWLSSVLTGVWTFYWWTVFSAARTARAWVWEGTAPPNAPLRWWMWVTEKVPGFRWWGPRLVTWLWVRTTQSMFSPAKAVELDFGAFVGLSVARLLGNVPLVRVFVRPAMSVVAAEILVAKAVANPALAAVTGGDLLMPTQHERDRAGV